MSNRCISLEVLTTRERQLQRLSFLFFTLDGCWPRLYNDLWKILTKPLPIPPEHHATSPTTPYAILSAPSIRADNSASSVATRRQSNPHTLAFAPPGKDPRRGARTTPPARSPALPRTRRASPSAPRFPAGFPDPPTATHQRDAQSRLVRFRRLQGRTACSTPRAANGGWKLHRRARWRRGGARCCWEERAAGVFRQGRSAFCVGVWRYQTSRRRRYRPAAWRRWWSARTGWGVLGSRCHRCAYGRQGRRAFCALQRLPAREPRW